MKNKKFNNSRQNSNSIYYVRVFHIHLALLALF